jgi:NAD-dependent DNA ligase
MDSREAFIALNLIEGGGPVRVRSLLEYFGDAPKILAASKSEILRVPSIGADTAENISHWEKSADLAQRVVFYEYKFLGGRMAERGRQIKRTFPGTAFNLL